MQHLPNNTFDVQPPKGSGKQNDLIQSWQEDKKRHCVVNPMLIPRCDHYMDLYPLQKIPLEESKPIDKANTEQYLAKWLIQIIQECGINKHNVTLKNNDHVGDDNNYHMSYPQPIFQEIAIYLGKHLDKKTHQLAIDGVNVKFSLTKNLSLQ